MRSLLSATTALGLLATDLLVAASNVSMNSFPKVVRGHGYLSVPVTTVQRPASSKRAVMAFEDKLYNMDFFYATDVDIGHPSQRVTVLLDTGSSELWVNPDCRTAKSKKKAEQCYQFGKYDPRKSKTSGGPFGQEQLNYGDPSDLSTQTSVAIVYYTDTLSLGGAVITNQTFGVVSRSRSQSQGILGLAPDMKAGFDTHEPYRLVLSSMAAEGVIASRVYALDIRHSDSQYGAVIYGGFDKSKFIGALEKRPIVKGIKNEYRLAVELTSIGVTTNLSVSSRVAARDANVMLDSGTTVSRLHSAIAMPILQALGAQAGSEGFYQVPCSTQNAAGSVDFGFGHKTIRVPFKDFILDVDGHSLTCYVGLVLTTDQQILGDSVLRAGYFVFDWDNQEVHIAQAANCGNNDIVAVTSGKKAVPAATGNCKEGDAVFTGGSQAQQTTDSLSTRTYTAVHTVTSCAQFDPGCLLGVVTTQSVAAATRTGSADNVGIRATVSGGLLVMAWVLAMIINVL